jgi:hypothetical protein
MAEQFQQTATAAGAGSAVACSGAVLIGGGQEKNSLCTVGGTPAASPVTVGGSQFDAGAGQAGVMYEIVPVGYVWAAGDYVVRLNVTSANANITWTGTFICRLNSANVNQATIGSLTGQTTSLSATGVKTHTVSGSAQTPTAGDKIYAVLVFNSGGANQSFACQFDQLIDTPLVMPVSITPGVADLLMAGAAPTVEESQTPVEITPSVAALVIQGIAPEVLQANLITPQVGTLVANGIAPTVQEGSGDADVEITVPIGALIAAGQAARLGFSVITPTARKYQ